MGKTNGNLSISVRCGNSGAKRSVDIGYNEEPSRISCFGLGISVKLEVNHSLFRRYGKCLLRAMGCH